MSESLFQIASEKVESLRQSLRDAQQEKELISLRERGIVRQIDAWKVILEAETPAIDIPAGIDQNGNVIAHYAVDVLNIPSNSTKTDVARLYSIQRGELGFSTKQLAAYLDSKGLGSNPGFANSFVFRMLKAKELIHTSSNALKATDEMRKNFGNEKEVTEVTP